MLAQFYNILTNRLTIAQSRIHLSIVGDSSAKIPPPPSHAFSATDLIGGYGA